MTKTFFSTLKNHLLLAMPGLRDPNFAHAVIYICDHSDAGAMGLTINHPTDIPSSQVFKELNLDCPDTFKSRPLLAGGPVETEKGFVLHRTGTTRWQSTLEVSSEISLTVSRDIIEAMAKNQGPPSSYITLGYAGWGPGQLEREITDNAWLTLPADPDIIFEIPFEQRANATAAMLGIDLNRMSIQAGHA